MNPFMPDRGELVETRHIPYPEQGSALMSSQGTPPDFVPLNSQSMPPAFAEQMAIEWNQAAPPNIGATADLMREGIMHDMLGVIPRVADFPSGPGDDDNGPGWM